MRWLEYLEGIERKELLGWVAEPDEEKEPLVWLVWQAAEKMIETCQYNVEHRAGLYARLQAVRVETHQTKTRPLQPYMDRQSIKQHALPWKKILAFFVRTRGGNGPRFRFGRDEKYWFDEMMGLARKRIKKEIKKTGSRGRQVDKGNEASADSSRSGSRSSSSSNGSDNNQDSTSRSRSSSNSQISQRNRDGEEEPPAKLKGLELKVLRFCMALLQRKTDRSAYKLPLVCASAVLGAREQGWAGPENYPPILARIIKISRFMVIQAALQRHGDGDEDDENSEAEKEVSGFLKYVVDQMNSFMIRGSHGAIKWFLSSKAYGLKIYLVYFQNIRADI